MEQAHFQWFIVMLETFPLLMRLLAPLRILLPINLSGTLGMVTKDRSDCTNPVFLKGMFDFENIERELCVCYRLSINLSTAWERHSLHGLFHWKISKGLHRCSYSVIFEHQRSLQQSTREYFMMSRCQNVQQWCFLYSYCLLVCT